MKFLYIAPLLSLILIAQTSAQSQIKGRINDSLSAKSLEFAIISIYKTNDTKPLDGKLTDSTGRFEFNNLNQGIYDLKFELIGYQTKTIKSIELKSNQSIELGSISLKSISAQLDEVLVKGEQDPNQNKLDKQTYKADQFQAAKGGTAIDVLKNTPSIAINAEGEMRLRGSTGFLILINGKPVIADFATVLNQIPANAIENIEIIIAPSAKYDADGKSGIINITLKKGTDDGLNFTINTQYGLPSVDTCGNKELPNRYGADFTLNYKKNKWDLALGGSYLKNDISGFRDGDVNTTINNVYTQFPSTGEKVLNAKT